MIQVQCAGCESRFQTRDEHAGKTTKCPSCGNPVVIPQPGEGELELALDLPAQPPRPPANPHPGQPARYAHPLASQANPYQQFPSAGQPRLPQATPPQHMSTSSLAVASMVTSLIALVLPCIGFLPGMVGIALGAFAIYRITRPNSGLQGGPFAVVGMIVGGLAMLWLYPLIASMIAVNTTANQFANMANLMQTPQTMQSMHQSMVSYAAGNNGYFPGMDSSGEVVDATASGRLQILVESGMMEADALILPWDTGLQKWDQAGGEDLKPGNFSFALLQFDNTRITTGRKKEWRSDGSPSAVVLSLRNIGNGAENDTAKSPWPADDFSSPSWGAINADGSLAEAVPDPSIPEPDWADEDDYYGYYEVAEPRYETSYNGVTSDYDSLFLDGDGSEKGKTMKGSNAYLVHD